MLRKTHKKRRSIWVDVLFSTIIFSIVLATITMIFVSTKKVASSPPGNSSGDEKFPILTDLIDSNYPGIKISTKISNDPKAPFALQFPQSLHNSFNNKVKDYITNTKNHYLTEINDYQANGGEDSGELNISFETFPHHTGLYSFVLLNSTFLGGDNGYTDIMTFRYHPKTGHEITIEDIFDNDTDRLYLVSEIVREILYTDESYKDKLLVEAANLHTEPNWDNYQNFALTNDAIIFYFNQYEIASPIASIPIVSVPLERLNKLVSKRFKLDDETSDDQQNSEYGDNPLQEFPDMTDKESVPNSNKDKTDKHDESDDAEKPNVKKVALTFDDGPDPKVTTSILATLKKYDAKATFFMLGSRVEYYPEIAKDVYNAGHEIGNHTWTHPDLTNASIKKINKEISRTSTIIEEVTGEKAELFRPPYGSINKLVRQQTGLPVILWDVDTLDWKHRNANQLLANVKKRTKDGSIILMHDIHQSTADGLDAVLTYLKSEGYTFVTVSELNEE